jgi:hypothetical protein
MTMYTDIYNDFPLRCYEVWQATKPMAKEMRPSREVTLMIMAAAGGLAMAHEHIKVSPNNASQRINHPAFHNIKFERYEKALQTIKKELLKGPTTSSLFMSIPPEQLFLTRVLSEDRIRSAFEEGRAVANPKNKKNTKDIVRILRNALCHNNVVALGDKGVEIGLLGFYSEALDCDGNRLGYDLVGMQVRHFETFLENWFALLKRISGPRSVPLALVLTNALEPDDNQIAA